MEKFLLTAILILASSSVVTVLKLQSLPQQVADYEKFISASEK